MKQRWKEISDNDKISVGTLIKGYTYSIEDYHNNLKPSTKKFLGDPKLRKGIVVEVFSNKIFKVQFENSAAKKTEKQRVTNKIFYKFKQDSLTDKVIQGTDAYCILLQRKQIIFVSQNETYITNDIEKLQSEIILKHSREKKSAIRYVQSENFKKGLPKEKVNEIFRERQYTKKEKYLPHEKAWEKICLLNQRHKSKNCVNNEYQKIKTAHEFLEEEKLTSNDKLKYKKFLKESSKEHDIKLIKNKQNTISEYELE